MKRIYINVNGVRYSVVTKPMVTNSNYDTSITIKRVGEKLPIWGTIIKSTDDACEIAKSILNNLSDYE